MIILWRQTLQTCLSMTRKWAVFYLFPVCSSTTKLYWQFPLITLTRLIFHFKFHFHFIHNLSFHWKLTWHMPDLNLDTIRKTIMKLIKFMLIKSRSLVEHAPWSILCSHKYNRQSALFDRNNYRNIHYHGEFWALKSFPINDLNQESTTHGIMCLIERGQIRDSKKWTILK